MKKTLLLFFMSFIFLLGANVQAQEWDAEFCCEDDSNFYAKFFGGANILQNSSVSGHKITYRTGYILSGSVGYRWCNGVKLEGEYAYRRNAINKMRTCCAGSSDNGNIHTSSYMANLLWDLPFSSWGCGSVRPFVGGGIGYDNQKLHSSNSWIVFNDKRHHFAWQLMAGLAMPLFCNAEATVEYRFHQAGCHFNNHAIGVGFVYNFNFFK